MDGTLLGAFRDARHIEGSGDIDIGVVAEDVPRIKNFGNGVVSRFGGLPVYWNYPGDPIINVTAWHAVGDRYFHFAEGGRLIVGPISPDDEPEDLLTRWYGDWKTPQPGVHATREIYKLTFFRKDP